MFVVCGEALVDIFLENNTQHPNNTFPLHASLGGSSFNVAIGLARLGLPTALLTGMSNDIFGKRLKAALSAEGVSQKLIIDKQLPSTIAFIEKYNMGVPTYTFFGEGTADRSLHPKDVRLQLDSPIGIHLGSYSIVSQPTADSFYSLIKENHGKCLISLDPNIREVVEPDMRIWKKRINELIPLSNIVKVSDEDLRLLYPNDQPEDIIQQWLATGLNLVVLTRGSIGSSLWSVNAQVDISTPKIEVIDTVGAGDTYQAALLYCINHLCIQHGNQWSEKLSEMELKNIGDYSTFAAAITCSRQGADLPTNIEIAHFLKNHDK